MFRVLMMAIAMASVALVCTGITEAAHAEIHLAWSLEQMAVEADVIAIGTLAEVKRVDGLGKKKSGIQLPISLTLERLVKGAQSYGTDVPKTLYFTSDGLHEKRFRSLEGKRVLLFFKRTHQSYLHDEEGPYEHWLLHDMETAPFVIDLEGLPEQYALSGKDFDQPDTEAAVVALLERVVQRQEAELDPAAPLPSPKFMECPPESKAFGALYEGSSTYLYVPGFLFPEAKDGM